MYSKTNLLYYNQRFITFKKIVFLKNTDQLNYPIQGLLYPKIFVNLEELTNHFFYKRGDISLAMELPRSTHRFRFNHSL